MLEQNFLLVILLLLGFYISLRTYEMYSNKEDDVINNIVTKSTFNDVNDINDNDTLIKEKQSIMSGGMLPTMLGMTDDNMKEMPTKCIDNVLKVSDLTSKEDSKNMNINSIITEAKRRYRKDISKYNIGSKSYEYDFIDNEQPLVGLSQNYNNTYPSTLKKSNKMIVDQEPYNGNYSNLLNTQNNSLSTYYNDIPKYS